ncbi:hypothetical protein YYE_04414 [Plasmodium vinckei vinckei]|uniref:PIR protein CIR protein n=1 Tax=Plasmodium vinckei vinckei TaxID=54757 RepID=A0A081IA77_PLAVN|nr:hypothetical protein YYE_04414 [Plasmodium vinckei vinckei]
MGVKELCEKFIAADKIINDEIEGNLTMWDIINDPEFKTYCGSSKCETNMQIIGGLSAYLFMKERVLQTSVMENSGQYDEFFLMWLSDKLFEIVKGKPQINGITLNSAYEQYLKNNIVNSNHLDLLDKLNGLEEVNLMHMKHFYKLLNDICKVIAYYNPNDKDNNKLISNSTNCSNQYKSLYDSVPKCNSYLHLLDNLKKTYYSFIDSVINENNKKTDLAWDLKTLKTSDGKDNYFAKDFKTFDFNSSECKPKKPKKSGPSKKPEQPPSQLPSKEPSPPPAPSSASSKKDTTLKTFQTGGTYKNGPDDPKSKQNALDSKKLNQGGGINDPRAPTDGTDDPASGGSGTPNTPGEFFDLWSPFRVFLLNGKGYFDKASYFIEQRINDIKDQISDAYNNAAANLKSIYSASNDYFNSIIDNITTQLNQVWTPKSGSSENNLPQNDVVRMNKNIIKIMNEYKI